MMDCGPINKKEHKSLVQTAVKYKDSQGKTRYKGAGKALRDTQFPSRVKYNMLFHSFWFCVHGTGCKVLL